MKIAVAMSGGIDSSVAAALLLKDNPNVFGITMKHYENNSSGFNPDEGITASIKDAKQVADTLGIEHFVIDLQQDFQNIVESNFIEEYKAGRTPNPCTLCNPTIKWGKLLEEAEKMGAEKIATGHYANLIFQQESYRILKSRDIKKDQSYMLWGLNQTQLRKTLFPVGNLTKKEIRKIANELKLPIHDKKDSQEICFIKGHYEDYLRKKIKFQPGNLTLPDGKIIGKHRGLPLYTIGQRKGLNTPWSSPLYVLNMDIQNNVLIVTENLNDLKQESFCLKDLNWLAGAFPEQDDTITVQIRYNSDPVPVRKFELQSDRMKVFLKNSTKAVTPGQSAVFYRGTELLGGGIII
jgi:tRNA-uridine 2-sulfurtransferase